MNKTTMGLLSAAVVAAMGPAAYGACPINGATPFYAAPAAPVNGFPEYVTGSDGLALTLCLNDQMCLFDPPIAGNDFSQTIGFGAEGFWWSADSAISRGGLNALIVMGVEAAFATEEPAPGDQFPFTRLRLRVDLNQAGIYTITHPFGQEVYVIANPGRRAINDSFDIEFLPDAVNQGRVGPWLTWDTFPGDPLLQPNGANGADFVGDINVPHAIKGSPCGNNLFRIAGTELDGSTPLTIDSGDQDGDGSESSLTETLFTVQGQVFRGNVLTPLSVGGVTYSRNRGGITRLNVHAIAPATSTVSYDTDIDGSRSGGAVSLTGDAAGRFFVTESLGQLPPPNTIEVVATNEALPNNDTAIEVVPVVDIIRVSSAAYDPVARTLQVLAHSSDEFDSPTLTVLGSATDFGDLDLNGALTATDLDVAPATVTIQSSNGGLAVAPVQVIQP